MREQQTRVQRIATHLRRIPPIFVEWTSIILILLAVTLCTFSGNFPLISWAVPHDSQYGQGCNSFQPGTLSVCTSTTTKLCWQFDIKSGSPIGNCSDLGYFHVGGCIAWDYLSGGTCIGAAATFAPTCPNNASFTGTGCSDNSQQPTCQDNSFQYDPTNHICYKQNPFQLVNLPNPLQTITNGSSQPLYTGASYSPNTGLQSSSNTGLQSSSSTGLQSSSNTGLQSSSSTSFSSSPAPANSIRDVSQPCTGTALTSSSSAGDNGFVYTGADNSVSSSSQSSLSGNPSGAYVCKYSQGKTLACYIYPPAIINCETKSGDPSAPSGMVDNHYCDTDSNFNPISCHYFGNKESFPVPHHSRGVATGVSCSGTSSSSSALPSSALPSSALPSPTPTSSTPTSASPSSFPATNCTIYTCLNTKGKFTAPSDSLLQSSSLSASSLVPQGLQGTFKCQTNQVQAQITQSCTPVSSNTPLVCTYTGTKTEILSQTCTGQSGINCQTTDLNSTDLFRCEQDTNSSNPPLCSIYQGSQASGSPLWVERCTPMGGTHYFSECDINTQNNAPLGSIKCSPSGNNLVCSTYANSNTPSATITCDTNYQMSCTTTNQTECNQTSPNWPMVMNQQTFPCYESLVAYSVLNVPTPLTRGSVEITYTLSSDELNFILKTAGIGSQSWNTSNYQAVTSL
jgi:hypothetical protein